MRSGEIANGAKLRFVMPTLALSVCTNRPPPRPMAAKIPRGGVWLLAYTSVPSFTPSPADICEATAGSEDSPAEPEEPEDYYLPAERPPDEE